MIIVLTTAAHRDTHKALTGLRGLPLRVMAYERLFGARQLPRACYVFTDLDRLSFWGLELAAVTFAQLRSAGVPVLNDPARARQRYGLLRHLYRLGLNRFNVWRVEDDPAPERFPVFLRLEAAHRGVLSGLLQDQQELDAAIEAALTEGHPRRDLMVVEYCARPTEDGLFRKFAMYRIGDRMVPALSVNDSSWQVKYGQAGIAGPDWYRQELELTRSSPFAECLRARFDAAGIDYGRADFSLVEGAVQLYEINTNPMVTRPSAHVSADRMQSAQMIWEQLTDAFRALTQQPAATAGGPVPLEHPILVRQRKRDRWSLVSRWMP